MAILSCNSSGHFSLSAGADLCSLLVLGTKSAASGFKEMLGKGASTAFLISLYVVPNRDPNWSHLLM